MAHAKRADLHSRDVMPIRDKWTAAFPGRMPGSGRGASAKVAEEVVWSEPVSKFPVSARIAGIWSVSRRAVTRNPRLPADSQAGFPRRPTRQFSRSIRETAEPLRVFRPGDQGTAEIGQVWAFENPLVPVEKVSVESSLTVGESLVYAFRHDPSGAPRRGGTGVDCDRACPGPRRGRLFAAPIRVAVGNEPAASDQSATSRTEPWTCG
jgi:hypothetical protein